MKIMNFSPNLVFLNRSFDKKRLKALLLWFRLNLSEGAALEAVEVLQGLGFRSATQGAISLGLDDLKTPKSKNGRVFQAQLEVALAHHEHYRGNRTPVELFQHLVDTWHRTSQDLTTEVVQLFHSTERVNPVYMMAFSGARGNLSQVRQLVGMRGLMADPRGQIVGFPILSNFREGLTITEYFVSCYGARKGVVDTAIRTADAGYLTRRLADVSHHFVVRTTNCGTDRTICLRDIKEGQKTILPLESRLVGRVLGEHIPKIAFRNQEINPDLASKLASHRTSLQVRSPLSCSLRWGVCQLCYGWGLSEGRRVTLGEAVGIIAAQSIGEPGTQLTLRTFHTGGVFSGDLLNEIRAPYNGTVFFPSPLQGLLVRTPHGQIAFLTKVSGRMVISFSCEGLPKTSEKSMALLDHESAIFDVEKENPATSCETCTENSELLPNVNDAVTHHTSNRSVSAKEIKEERSLGASLQSKKLLDERKDQVTIKEIDASKENKEFFLQPSTVIFVRQKEQVLINQLLAEFSSSTLQPISDQIEVTQQVLSESAGQVWFKKIEYGNRKGPGSGSLGTHFSSQKLGGVWVLAGKPRSQSILDDRKHFPVHSTNLENHTLFSISANALSTDTSPEQSEEALKRCALPASFVNQGGVKHQVQKYQVRDEAINTAGTFDLSLKPQLPMFLHNVSHNDYFLKYHYSLGYSQLLRFTPLLQSHHYTTLLSHTNTCFKKRKKVPPLGWEKSFVSECKTPNYFYKLTAPFLSGLCNFDRRAWNITSKDASRRGYISKANSMCDAKQENLDATQIPPNREQIEKTVRFHCSEMQNLFLNKCKKRGVDEFSLLMDNWDTGIANSTLNQTGVSATLETCTDEEDGASLMQNQIWKKKHFLSPFQLNVGTNYRLLKTNESAVIGPEAFINGLFLLAKPKKRIFAMQSKKVRVKVQTKQIWLEPRSPSKMEEESHHQRWKKKLVPSQMQTKKIGGKRETSTVSVAWWLQKKWKVAPGTLLSEPLFSSKENSEGQFFWLSSSFIQQKRPTPTFFLPLHLPPIPQLRLPLFDVTITDLYKKGPIIVEKACIEPLEHICSAKQANRKGDLSEVSCIKLPEQRIKKQKRSNPLVKKLIQTLNLTCRQYSSINRGIFSPLKQNSTFGSFITLLNGAHTATPAINFSTKLFACSALYIEDLHYQAQQIFPQFKGQSTEISNLELDRRFWFDKSIALRGLDDVPAHWGPLADTFAMQSKKANRVFASDSCQTPSASDEVFAVLGNVHLLCTGGAGTKHSKQIEKKRKKNGKFSQFFVIPHTCYLESNSISLLCFVPAPHFFAKHDVQRRSTLPSTAKMSYVATHGPEVTGALERKKGRANNEFNLCTPSLLRFDTSGTERFGNAGHRHEINDTYFLDPFCNAMRSKNMQNKAFTLNLFWQPLSLVSYPSQIVHSSNKPYSSVPNQTLLVDHRCNTTNRSLYQKYNKDFSNVVENAPVASSGASKLRFINQGKKKGQKVRAKVVHRRCKEAGENKQTSIWLSIHISNNNLANSVESSSKLALSLSYPLFDTLNAEKSECIKDKKSRLIKRLIEIKIFLRKKERQLLHNQQLVGKKKRIENNDSSLDQHIVHTVDLPIVSFPYIFPSADQQSIRWPIFDALVPPQQSPIDGHTHRVASGCSCFAAQTLAMQNKKVYYASSSLASCEAKEVFDSCKARVKNSIHQTDRQVIHLGALALHCKREGVMRSEQQIQADRKISEKKQVRLGETTYYNSRCGTPVQGELLPLIRQSLWQETFFEKSRVESPVFYTEGSGLCDALHRTQEDIKKWIENVARQRLICSNQTHALAPSLHLLCSAKQADSCAKYTVHLLRSDAKQEPQHLVEQTAVKHCKGGTKEPRSASLGQTPLRLTTNKHTVFVQVQKRTLIAREIEGLLVASQSMEKAQRANSIGTVFKDEDLHISDIQLKVKLPIKIISNLRGRYTSAHLKLPPKSLACFAPLRFARNKLHTKNTLPLGTADICSAKQEDKKFIHQTDHASCRAKFMGLRLSSKPQFFSLNVVLANADTRSEKPSSQMQSTVSPLFDGSRAGFLKELLLASQRSQKVHEISRTFCYRLMQRILEYPVERLVFNRWMTTKRRKLEYSLSSSSTNLMQLEPDVLFDENRLTPNTTPFDPLTTLLKRQFKGKEFLQFATYDTSKFSSFLYDAPDALLQNKKRLWLDQGFCTPLYKEDAKKASASCSARMQGNIGSALYTKDEHHQAKSMVCNTPQKLLFEQLRQTASDMQTSEMQRCTEKKKEGLKPFGVKWGDANTLPIRNKIWIAENKFTSFGGETFLGWYAFATLLDRPLDFSKLPLPFQGANLRSLTIKSTKPIELLQKSTKFSDILINIEEIFADADTRSEKHRKEIKTHTSEKLNSLNSQERIRSLMSKQLLAKHLLLDQKRIQSSENIIKAVKSKIKMILPFSSPKAGEAHQTPLKESKVPFLSESDQITFITNDQILISNYQKHMTLANQQARVTTWQSKSAVFKDIFASKHSNRRSHPGCSPLERFACRAKQAQQIETPVIATGSGNLLPDKQPICLLCKASTADIPLRFTKGYVSPKPRYLYPGQLVTYGEKMDHKIATTESGQVLYLDSQRATLRKAQTVLIYSQAILSVLSGDWIKKSSPLMALSYQKLVTGDIVQGLPKIEQFFEAPLLKDGSFWSDSLQAKLNLFFQEYRGQFPLAEAVRKGFSDIQRVLVEGVQRVYISQGVLIADKHLEVIVRQMTCKGRILYSGDTGFLRNELVALDKIESVNQVTYGQKALYHPQVRGITDASLESESFLSAASFQETTRVLSRDAVIGKTDLMRGLKERVIVGELIQAGTGLTNNSVYNSLLD